jgi:signal transduction histidine kinase
VVVDAAWLQVDVWSHRSAPLRALTSASFEDVELATLVELGAEEVGVPEFSWELGRAANARFVLGVADPSLELTDATMITIATGVDALVARDEAVATARTTALLLERARIASEIHQGVCQEISTLHLQLQVLQELFGRDQDGARRLLGEIERSAELCSQSLRSAIVHLTPVIPDNSWPAGALQRFICEFAEEWDMTLEFDVRGPIRQLDPELLALLFAFVQEGLTNMRKHSAARRGVVQVSFDEGCFRADILDHDVFVVASGATETAPPLGHGLSLMRSRARLLGGDVRFFTAKCGGTRLSLEVPS